MTTETEILLKFSESVSLTNAAAERDRHLAAIDRACGQSSTPCVADLSDLRDVDTSALAVLLALDRRVREKTNAPLVIRAAPEAVRSLAALSSLDAVLHWEETTL
jgi:ABC-type transporter Mla MlaB component